MTARHYDASPITLIVVSSSGILLCPYGSPSMCLHYYSHRQELCRMFLVLLCCSQMTLTSKNTNFRNQSVHENIKSKAKQC